MSSGCVDCLSVEKGVFSSKKGLCSRCLEMRDSLARGEARINDGRGLPPRQKRARGNAARMASFLSTTLKIYSCASDHGRSLARAAR